MLVNNMLWPNVTELGACRNPASTRQRVAEAAGGASNRTVFRDVAQVAGPVDEHQPRSGGAGSNRAFMRHTVAYLAAEGTRQFLDIGTGIPTKPNLHKVVQDIAPDARIVYADNDPVVLAHALLVGTPEGTTSYLQADLRDPGMILQEAARTLDLAQPTAVILAAILQLISDEEDPHGIGYVRES
jgi:hypothetical protein